MHFVTRKVRTSTFPQHYISYILLLPLYNNQQPCHTTPLTSSLPVTFWYILLVLHQLLVLVNILPSNERQLWGHYTFRTRYEGLYYWVRVTLFDSIGFESHCLFAYTL